MAHDVLEARSSRGPDLHAPGAHAGGPGKHTLVQQAAFGVDPIAPPPALAAPLAVGGSPLPGPTLGRMERLFGADFGEVRVHQGAHAERAGAQAYAQGSDLHFAPGRFDPQGGALLGHELAHVVQHAEGRAPGPQAKGAGGDAALEREADDMAARVASGEPARPGAAHVVARREPAAAIQRMIERAAPDAGSDWAQILRYLDKTLINQRKQTFVDAVTEYLDCGLAPDTQVADAWRELEAHRSEVGGEAAALARITTIRTAINAHKSAEPDHPNKRGIGPARERYETVPQSARSQAIAATLRARLLADMFGGQYRAHSKKFHDGTRLVPLGDDKWRTSFMLAVLILPNGAVQVAHSGFLGAVQSAAFRAIVRSVDRAYATTTHDNDVAYAALQKLYKDSLTSDQNTGKLPANHRAEVDRADKHKHKVIATGAMAEKGNPTGVCAAPQVLAPADDLATPFPTQLTGNAQMALTEVLVRDSNAAVDVKDATGTAQPYDKHSPDVPSCLSCQHQLRELLTKLVELRRNVVNLENVKTAEGERAKLLAATDELRALVGAGGKVATIVLGQQSVAEKYTVSVPKLVPKYKKPPVGKPVEMKTKLEETRLTRKVPKDRAPAKSPTELAGDVSALDKLIAGYRKAVQTQATERTKHPEFIEHDEHTTQPSLHGLATAEADAEREHGDNHLEALLARRITVGKLFGGASYNDEREEASKHANIGPSAEAAHAKRDAAADADASARNKADDAAREQAGVDARHAAAKRRGQASADARREATRADRDEDAQRNQAGKDAKMSAARHHHQENIRFSAETEEADRVLGLAISLAQAFDTAIEHQLELLQSDEPTEPTPKTDFSDDYIS